MKNYCLRFPICPVCHAPFNDKKLLKVNYDDVCGHHGHEKILCEQKCYRNIYKYMDLNSDNVDICLYKCCNDDCKSYFRNNIDLEDFQDTCQLMRLNEDYNYPYYWNISLNRIENSYIHWIEYMIKNENYFVYWPWREVEFLPIFLAEYYMLYPYKKIVVIEKINEKNDYVTKPDTYESLNNLFTYFKSYELPKKIKNDIALFEKGVNDYRYLLYPNIVLKYYVHSLSKDIKSYYFYEDLRDYKKEPTNGTIQKRFEKKYGKGSVKKVEYDEKIKEYPVQNPLIEIEVRQAVKKDYDVQVNYEEYWNVLSNFSTLRKVASPKGNGKYNVLNDNLFFLDINSDNLIESLKEINPNVIILKNADEILFDYNIQKDYVDYVNSSKVTTISFSTKRDMRFKYNNLLKKFNSYIIHSWDNEEVLNQFKPEKTSVLSSDIKTEKKIGVDIDFVEIPQLSLINSLKKDLSQKSENKNFRKRVINFLKYLLVTPIQIREDSEGYNYDFDDMDIYGWFYEIEYELDDDEFISKIREIIDEVYCRESDFNPLISEIKRLISKNKDDYSQIILITQSNKYKKTMQRIFNQETQDNIIVSTWNNLIIDNNKDYLVISTIKTKKDLYIPQIKKYYFVGSPESIVDMKKYVNNKTSVDITRPLIIINEGEAPHLLYNCLENISELGEKIKTQNKLIEKENDIEIDNVTSRTDDFDSVEDFPEKISIKKHIKKSKTERSLKDTEKVLLLVNETTQMGMFIPKDCQINYKTDNETIAIFDFKKESNKNIIGKDIIIDEHGFYNSFKEFFIKFMIDNYESSLEGFNDQTITDFKQLTIQTYSWLKIIRTFLEDKYSKKIIQDDETYVKTKYEIARIIRELGITYGNDYIVNVWLSEPNTIETSKGNIDIYSIEHPISSDTLKILYTGLSEKYDFDLTVDDAISTYKSGVYLQKIKNYFMKNKIPQNFKGISNKFNHYMKHMILNSMLFKVDTIKTVTLKDSVKSYKMINNYEDYI